MKIYVIHASNFDYINKLYEPLESSQVLEKHSLFFPHKDEAKEIKTKELIKNCDLVIAEVSLPSTGLGIELGWSDYVQTPILCVYEKGYKVSPSLKLITNNFIEYKDTNDLIDKISTFINNS